MRLGDPVLFNLYESLQTGDPEDCFLSLYTHAREGKLGEKKQFVSVCEMVNDRVKRELSSSITAKYGQRYSRAALDFMLLLRGYGLNSNLQYDIISAELCGPSVRHLR